MADLIVVFGAAVRADGTASPTLRRRTRHAAEAALADPGAALFCTGGIGRFPPSEASVMQALLAPSIDPARIVLDETSRDTLQSVRAATVYARDHGFARCLTCTDEYHQPRVAMLFRLFGMTSDRIAFGPREADVHSSYWWKMRVREAAALPYDLVAGLAARVWG